MRPAEEMDQADMELRQTIKKIWPIQAKKNLNLIVPPDDGECGNKAHIVIVSLPCFCLASLSLFLKALLCAVVQNRKLKLEVKPVKQIQPLRLF